MKTNFAKLPQQRLQFINMVIIAVLAIVLLLMFLDHGNVKRQINELMAKQQQFRPDTQMNIPVSENDLRRSALAETIYQDLTFPWQHLLAGLEAVKRDYKHVHYTAISPVKTETAFLLSAQTGSVSEMLAFITALEANAAFQNVRLLNQQQNEQYELEFTAKIGWVPDA